MTLPNERYTVKVDDNFKYMDEDERYTLGGFETLEAAIAACKKIVDEFLLEHHKPGMSAADLYSNYKSFGEDPFICGLGVQQPFSAWAYAKERCHEICGEV